MNSRFKARAFGLLLMMALFAAAVPLFAQTANAQPEAVLHSADVAKLIPASVFFRGQTASTQLRNAGGVRFADGFYALASLVDNSGYSTGLQEKYQAYLITEVPLSIGGHTLSPGAYGAGIIKGADSKNGDSLQFVVQDLGAHDLFQTTAASDAKLHRPTPLQVLPGGASGKYRLYFGRHYVELERAQ